MLSTCFWIVLGDSGDVARCSRKGRNRASNSSASGRCFSSPIHERGQPFKSRQWCSRSWRIRVAARFYLVVLAFTSFHFMLQLITILNRCHRFPGFVYQQARFSSDHKSIEITVRPAGGAKAVCSRCRQPAPGYGQLAERRLEFIPFWGFLVFLLYSLRRVDCRRCAAVKHQNKRDWKRFPPTYTFWPKFGAALTFGAAGLETFVIS